MEININIQKLKGQEVSTDDLIARIATGKAVLFTGAGFSLGTENIEGYEPPIARDLAKLISRLGGMEEETDLTYVSDFYLEYKDKSKLLELLKKCFTINKVSESHKSICKIGWKRFYTTNYDNSIEFSNLKAGKKIESVSSTESPDGYYKKNDICLHINGSIEKATEDSFNGEIKLSDSSYVSPDAFLESNWYYTFKKDLESSSAIIFAGYSLYDIEIKKILFRNPQFIEKTYFITRESPSHRETFSMKKYGQVLPIGIKGFAKLIEDNLEKITNDEFLETTEALVQYSTEEKETDIRDADVDSFLMHGAIKQQFIDSAISGVQEIPYLILRESLDKTVELLKERKNTLIFGELGNGKSIFLKEVASKLTNSGITTYTIEDEDGNYINDLDILAREKINCVVIIDGYERFYDLIQHYEVLQPDNITLLLAARTSEHEGIRTKLKDLSFSFYEINIDILSGDEVGCFVEIINNVGLWGDKASWPCERKSNYIKEKNHSQLSLSLLNILNSPQIKDRVANLTKVLFINKDYQDTVFAIALAEILDLRPNLSLVSEIALNHCIYDIKLRENTGFKGLFRTADNKILSKSSIFSLSLIQNHFSSAYIVDQLLKIVEKYNSLRNDGYSERSIFKSLLRFSFIERALPETNKKNNLTKYYEKLKIVVPWLKNDPHYWLQYGMSRLPYKDYPKAQSCFNTAYSLANSKSGYHTNNIDTQQARLFLLLSQSESNANLAFENFDKAHNLLSKLDNDVYKFRQVDRYQNVFESKFNSFSSKNKVAFEHACNFMVGEMERSDKIGEINIAEQKTIAKAKESIQGVINQIRCQRE